MPGDILGCHSWRGRGACFRQVAGSGQDAAKHPTMPQPVLYTKELSSPLKHFPVLRTKNPVLGILLNKMVSILCKSTKKKAKKPPNITTQRQPQSTLR